MVVQHLKDKNFLGKNVVIGSGKVNFTSIFKSLNKIDYKGNFVFENNRGEDSVITMRDNLNFIRSVTKKAGYKI
ncbi:hypothetical protein [uncultured Psychrobacter sp.]|uniref:hypothetical protein n=1 Tax=uncultured Psychrobacter sp. TaxID=259303 RepID=UPI00260BB770|nr:hypothetical protein [uncultured Psychrobacter sp.]